MRFDFESLVDEVESSVVLLEAVGQDAWQRCCTSYVPQ